MVGSDATKDLLFARMRVKQPGAGYIHFSDDLPDTYFQQLTAEKVVTRFVRGYKKRVFVKIRPRNEALDCFCYGIAALSILNTDVNSILDRLEYREDATEKEPQKNARAPFIPPMKKGFVNNW
jgi:phage terminase large subunit GpA-like protein